MDRILVAAKPKEVISRHFGTILSLPMPDIELTEGDVEKAEKMFDESDKDNNGTLSFEELQFALKRLNLRLDEEKTQAYFNKAWKETDVNEDGRVTLEEFLLLYSKVFAPAYYYGSRLRRACGRGALNIIRELISRGCNPNLGDGNGLTSLHHAASYGNNNSIRLLHQLLGEELFLDSQDNFGWTPLMSAAARGHATTVQLLIEYGADPEKVTTNGRNVLHIAACEGRDPVVHTLLSSVGVGLEIDPLDDNEWTPLNWASLHGHTSTISLLISHGAKVEHQDLLKAVPEDYCDPRTWQKATL